METAGAEEPSYSEQTNQGWLLLHVPTFISYWHCDSDCRHMVAGEILVIQTVLLLWLGMRHQNLIFLSLMISFTFPCVYCLCNFKLCCSTKQVGKSRTENRAFVIEKERYY